MENFLSPRKSWVAISVVCALSAAALWVGRTPSATPTAAAENPTQLHASPGLDSYAPHGK